MGYTHYWERASGEDSEIDHHEWQQIAEGTINILDQCKADGIRIACGLGHYLPQVTNFEILFNGYGDKSHETFKISRDIANDIGPYGEPNDDGFYFFFCKTAEKPYDAAVVSVLAYVGHVLDWDKKRIRISSDGGNIFAFPPYRP